MKRVIIWILLSAGILYAGETFYVSPKVALRMIDKKNIQFISLDKVALKIKKSKNINMEFLTAFDILGKQACSPLYLCPDKVEKYLSTLGLTMDEPLILYDNSYGIKSATFYLLLESMGHKNISILRGGIEDISHLDPNWSIYTKYLNELNELSDSKDISKKTTLTKKLKALKPHLLFEESVASKNDFRESNYTIEKSNSKYFISKVELAEVLMSVYLNEENVSVIDVCSMNSFPLQNLKSFSWKALIDKERNYLKSKKELKKIFKDLGLKKDDENYIYCMSGAQKAFLMMMALREVGYSKVKAFSGDWNVWIGDIHE